MSTDHYAAAERCISDAYQADMDGDATFHLAQAQVHATLALADASRPSELATTFVGVQVGGNDDDPDERERKLDEETAAWSARQDVLRKAEQVIEARKREGLLVAGSPLLDLVEELRAALEAVDR